MLLKASYVQIYVQYCLRMLRIQLSCKGETGVYYYLCELIFDHFVYVCLFTIVTIVEASKGWVWY